MRLYPISTLCKTLTDSLALRACRSDEEDDASDASDDEPLTEQERIEEGRRMFQIFAARMFEQRVLTAYREEVAAEKQNQLLREIEAEQRLAEEREAKKAKEAQKKKDKKKCVARRFFYRMRSAADPLT